MKRFMMFFAFILALAMLTINLPFITNASANQTEVDVKVNGKLVNFPDQNPFVDNKLK